MHTIFLDANSPYHVGIPSAEQWPELIDTTQTFVTYDQSLPPERQSPYTRHLIAMLNICVPLYETYESSESQRTIASETVKRLEAQLTRLTRQIHHVIKGALFETPEQAEEWGFQIRQSSQTILMPRSTKERLALLKKYIAQEESRPAAERFTIPNLETVKRLHADLITHRATRRSSRDRRKSSRAARDEAFAQLVDWLRMAAGHLMLDHFNHKISFEMQQWGYIVIERQSGRNGRSEESSVEPAPPEPAESEVDVGVEPDDEDKK
ncbi:MAG: hypothetical protein KDI62_24965 [Anaerolineae bacterium]|nr:hypothetical protein [Anaerolineae bacterium]MCB9106127.1 hypothetical protein [Anaerolineales bacterium]